MAVLVGVVGLTGVLMVWLASFFIMREATAVEPQPCRDVIGVAASCLAPEPSLLPAVPVATVVAAIALALVVWWRRRRVFHRVGTSLPG